MLMENMDPEMKKEFEEVTKGGNSASVTSTTQSIQNMDLTDSFASWMSGVKKDEPPTAPEVATGSKGRK